MKTRFACLSLAAFVFASCDKTETQTKPDDSRPASQVKTRSNAPRTADKPAPTPRETPQAIDRPLSHPVDAAMIRPTGTSPDDPSWETLTAEEKIAKFRVNGIARVPKYVSDQIITEATKDGVSEDQVDIIARQAAAWHRFNRFRKEPQYMPDHMKTALLGKLASKHGEAWLDIMTELDEQIAASIRVNELRGKGIPGLSPDESQNFFIQAIEKYGPDYKAILSAAERAAK